jgi:DNA-binding YbaB/EbfC family protein
LEIKLSSVAQKHFAGTWPSRSPTVREGRPLSWRLKPKPLLTRGLLIGSYLVLNSQDESKKELTRDLRHPASGIGHSMPGSLHSPGGKARMFFHASTNQIEYFEEVEHMKFPGGLNIQQMMKQAQQMQEKMSKEMEELRVEASSGGGVITVQMQGNHEIVSLKIDPEAVKEGDVEMLQDMILAAINEANRKVDEAMKGKIGGMLPPGLGGLMG